MRTKSLFAALMMSVLLSLFGCGASNTNTQTTQQSEPNEQSAIQEGQTTNIPGVITTAEGPFASGLHHIEIEVEDFGTIKVTLNADAAPVTVAHFCELAQDGFYDGLTFHRIIDGFMIQGGDPLGNGMGGADANIVGEFASNGYNNPIAHVRGTISMARAQDPNSASSQFFIMHQTTESLNGDYAAFGTVSEGMDVVDALATTIPVQDSNGTVAPEDQPTITTIRVID